MTAPSPELLAETMRQRSAGTWLWLYAIELATNASESRWLLVTSHSEPVTFDGETYHPWRVRFSRLDSGAPGDLPKTRIEISNLGGVGSEYLRQYGNLAGSRLVVRLANTLHLVSADHSVPHTYHIADGQASPAAVSLTIGQLDLHSRRCPRHRFSRLVCRYEFRDPMCGWTPDRGGDATGCDRSLDGPNGCVAHGNTARFGGQPSMPGTR